MFLDSHFFKVVDKLKAARAGTELMAPLLYSLIRTTRPSSVLEVGMGYTTPFILKALEDNKEDFLREIERLKDKNRDYLTKIENEEFKNLKQGAKPLALMDEWISQDPALASPDFYTSIYEPVLHAIDNFSSPNSCSRNVQEVLKTMNLDNNLKVYAGDFRDYKGEITEKGNNYLDFVWFDCGNAEDYKDFVEDYWDVISPDGGYLLLHSTLNRYSFHSVMTYFKSNIGKSEFYDVEVLSLLEPHKLTQGSVTMVKKIKKEIPKFPIENAYSLLNSIKKMV
jgi:hypothetical protein